MGATGCRLSCAFPAWSAPPPPSIPSVAGADGRFHPVWDTAIARLLNGRTPDLWPLFGALAHVPVMLVHGAVSNLLLPQTVAAMRARRPDMTVVTVPGVGHAPVLTEDVVRDALAAFVRG